MMRGQHRRPHGVSLVLCIVLLLGSVTATGAAPNDGLFVSHHGKGALLLLTPRPANEIVVNQPVISLADGTPIRQTGPDQIVGGVAWKPVEVEMSDGLRRGWIRSDQTSRDRPARNGGTSISSPREHAGLGRIGGNSSAGPRILPSSPSNDSFSQATTIGSLPAVFNVSTSDATVEANEPVGISCTTGDFGIGRTVWYRYTAPIAQTITITTEGSDFDTTMVAWEHAASLAQLSEGFCNDDFGGLTSQLTFDVTAGEIVDIQVGGYFDPDFGEPEEAESGNLKLTVSGTGAASATLSVTASGQGTVTSSPAGINCGATCASAFTTGTSITLSATPASGWGFDRWTGVCAGVDPTCVFQMPGASAETATFVNCTPRPKVTTSIIKNGDGRLRIGLVPGAGLIKLVGITLANATIGVVGGPSNVSGNYKPTNGASQITMLLSRQVVGGAFATLSVVDACGTWPTFAGAGAAPGNWTP